MAKNAATGSGTGNQMIGKVFIIYGTVKAVAPDGTVRILAPNSPVFADEKIITEGDGSISIMLDGPPPTQIDLGRMTEMVLDQDVYAGAPPEVVTEATAEAEKIQEALLQGDQPIELEATAAGGAGDTGGGHPIVNFALTGSEVTPGSGADTTGITTTTSDTIGGVLGETPQPTGLSGVVTLTATESVVEGGSIVYTASVNNPVTGSPLVVSLDNGQQITIPVGDSSADSAPFAVRADEAYVQGTDTITVKISGTSGGNYEALDTSDTASTSVTDDHDFTTVTLTASPVAMTEDGATITYTATLSSAVREGDDPVTVTFNDLLGNEHTITISSGLTGTEIVTVAESVFEDVYAEEAAGLGTLTAQDVAVAGGGFENLAVGEVSTTVTLSDTPDTTTVDLTASPVAMTEDGATITYTATLSSAVRAGDDPVTVTFDDLLGNVHTITISSGLTGTEIVTVAESVFEDVYAEEAAGLGTLTAQDVAVAGGGFENLAVGEVSTTVTLSDTPDTTTVDLTASPVAMTEDGATITYTATLSSAVRAGDDPVTVTFNDLLGNEHTITISSGLTGTEIVTVAESVFEDVYAEEAAGLGTLTAQDVAVAGGGFENLAVGEVSTTVTLSDTPDTTTVDLTASPVAMTEDGATITYTATLSSAVRAGDDPVTVTFDDLLGNVHTITISSGLTGTEIVTVAESVFEDVYAEEAAGLGTLTAQDVAVAGGGFENLAVGEVSTTVTLSDTPDTTTVDLTASPVAMTEDGATITYTATLSSAVRAGDDPVTVTFNDLLGNVHTITISSGLTGTEIVTVAESVFEDVYAEEAAGLGTLTAQDVAVAGGGFENLAVGEVSTTVTLSDTPDTTTVTLDASIPTSGETPGSYTTTITASVDHTPQTALSLKIVDGDGKDVGDIIIDTDGNPGSITVPVQLGVNYVYSVSGYTGGNYELLDYTDTADTYGPPNILNLSIVANSNVLDQYLLVEFSQLQDDEVKSFDQVVTLVDQGQEQIHATFRFDVGFDIDPAFPYEVSFKYLGNSGGSVGGQINITDLQVENASISDSGNIKLGDGGQSHDGFAVTVSPGVNSYDLSAGDYYDRVNVSGTTGDAADDAISGTKDADTLDGQGGYDLLMGGKGDDTLIGGDGKDGLTGGLGDDTLDGGLDKDLLSGGEGNDTLTGGSGADTFVFSQSGSSNVDHIIDYSSDEGDTIDLSGLLKDVTGSKVDHVKVEHTTDGTVVSVDLLGNGTFSEVVYLDDYNDQVNVLIDGQEHQL